MRDFVAPGLGTPDRPIAFVLKGYPRLSESFIAQEIHGLEQRGMSLRIISLRKPTDKQRHPVHALIQAPVSYLPEYLHDAPARVVRCLQYARRLPGFSAAYAAWRRDLRRDFSRNRVRRFGQAAVLACEHGDTLAHLHAHFLHTPASVTRYAAMMLGRSWTFSAHARDIWTSPDWELEEKLADCAWGVTCTQLNHAHLNRLAGPHEAPVELLYHGLDLERFCLGSLSYSNADGTDRARPVQLLSVGRAVEKKGYQHLLEALALVGSSVAWRLTHIGGGPLLETLRKQAKQLGIDACIDWRGACAQAEVLAEYRTADVFVLASKVAADGDRDGLPNVLVEAQSQGVAAVATRVSAIPELLTDGYNGLLVEPADSEQLAVALARCIRQPRLRETLGRNGAERVHASFSMHGGLDRLVQRFTDAADLEPLAATAPRSG
jgi:glycosyltransferase involved in cell wall biosynthesis